MFTAIASLYKYDVVHGRWGYLTPISVSELFAVENNSLEPLQGSSNMCAFRIKSSAGSLFSYGEMQKLTP